MRDIFTDYILSSFLFLAKLYDSNLMFSLKKVFHDQSVKHYKGVTNFVRENNSYINVENNCIKKDLKLHYWYQVFYVSLIINFCLSKINQNITCLLQINEKNALYVSLIIKLCLSKIKSKHRTWNTVIKFHADLLETDRFWMILVL